jgi:hypothetical protein
MAELWETLTHGFQGKISPTRAASARNASTAPTSCRPSSTSRVSKPSTPSTVCRPCRCTARALRRSCSMPPHRRRAQRPPSSATDSRRPRGGAGLSSHRQAPGPRASPPGRQGCHRLGRPVADSHGRVPREAGYRVRPPLPGALADLREAPLVPLHRQDRGGDHRAGRARGRLHTRA